MRRFTSQLHRRCRPARGLGALLGVLAVVAAALLPGVHGLTVHAAGPDQADRPACHAGHHHRCGHHHHHAPADETTTEEPGRPGGHDPHECPTCRLIDLAMSSTPCLLAPEPLLGLGVPCSRLIVHDEPARPACGPSAMRARGPPARPLAVAV